jgi:hypothetical protein
MKSFFTQLVIRTRRALWAIIVAYMLGMHNFYKEDKTTEDRVITIELNETRENGAPKD